MGHSCELLLQTAVRGLRELDTQTLTIRNGFVIGVAELLVLDNVCQLCYCWWV